MVVEISNLKGLKMKNFAIILSGCGQHDGSETHETILTLLALDRASVNWQGFAPDVTTGVIDHVTNTDTGGSRAVLQESARLVRGKIKPLSALNVADFDAIVFPGGMGAVKVLCNWYERKSDFTFNHDVKKTLDAAVELGKPLGFICIAPMMITKVFSDAKFTIGNDKNLAAEIVASGCQHVDCLASDIVIDAEHKLVTTPANMVANTIDEVSQGITKLVNELVKMST